MIPVAGQLLDMTTFRLKAEKEHGVRLPAAAPCLLDILSTPGALEELKRAQFGGAKTFQTEVASGCPPGCSDAETGARHVHTSSARASQSVLAVFPERVEGCPVHACTVPSLSQRLRDLSARLSLLRLRCAHGSRGGSSRRSSPMWVSLLGRPQAGRHQTEPVRGLGRTLPMWHQDALPDEEKPRPVSPWMWWRRQWRSWPRSSRMAQ